MPKSKTFGSLALSGYDSIFGNTTGQITGEHVEHIPLSELYPPDFHPFQVLDDPAMDRLVKSIKLYGVREPGLARQRTDGGYELIAGNRRKHASELAGLDSMPVIVRDMDDDTAAIAMVDSNLEQREKLLPSEKAWAYRVKLEALNHRGTKTDSPGQLSVEILCEQTGDCKNTIFRLIRLTELVPDLLDMVDDKRLGFNPGVEFSYLTRIEQALVVDSMAKHEVKPSISQAQRIKKASQNGGLTEQIVDSIFSAPKKTPDKTNKVADGYKRFFPIGYTQVQMDAVITALLQEWHAASRGG